MRTFAAAFLAMVLASLAGAGGAEEQPTAAPPSHYRVIVHPRNIVAAVGRRFVEDAFLRKITRWPDGAVIFPADLVAASPVRSGFSHGVLHRSTAAVKAYWQQRIFSGRGVPPPEFETDEKVVSYVLEHAAAVGYVSGTADLRGAKVVAVSE
jgi:hypothetical protein